MCAKIILSADTPCDIGSELQKRYDVHLFPLHIELEGKVFTDGVDITNEELYQAWWDRKALPKTAAINPSEYISHFKPMVDAGYEVIHLNIGSGLSSCHQNACIAAEELGHVHVIDSRNLSTGFGHLVCETGERILAGKDSDTIVKEIEELIPRISSSFVLDTLEFLHASGRCSNFAQLGATIMKIKPSITVLESAAGAMSTGRKYVGKFDRAVMKYVEDQLKDRDDIDLNRVFITSTCPDDTLPNQVAELVKTLQPFREVHITRASCTIGAHCGPNTLGVLFIRK